MLFVTKKHALLSLSAALLLFTAACNRNEAPPTPPAPPTNPAPPTTPVPPTTPAPPAAPATIALPNGFQPEGIAAGTGTTLYAGSLANGAVYQLDVATGEGSVLVEGEDGRVNVGMTFDSRTGYLFAAGGETGKAQVYDTQAGELLQTYTLNRNGTFVNDAVLSGNNVYFTNSNRSVFYRLALGENGALPAKNSGVTELPLTGAFALVPDLMAFNANGIAAAENGTLIIVKSATGQLFTVNPETGEAAEVDLGDADVTNGDGILLDGNTLYVVQNQDNKIAVVELSADLVSGTITNTLTNPAFDVPTTLADVNGTLYAVNARFKTKPTPDTEYTVVKLER